MPAALTGEWNQGHLISVRDGAKADIVSYSAVSGFNVEERRLEWGPCVTREC